jgi:inward rectifier potassium channel
MLRRARSRSASPPPLGGPLRSQRALRVHPIGERRWHPADIYHQLLGLSWTLVTLIFVAVFLGFNLLFAALYSLDPTGIYWGDRPVNAPLLARAFFFSVQTLATIGYGSTFPISVYANTLVVVEITIGVLLFAIVTGIAFARFSRPTARVRFSSVAVIHEVDGVPTLMFRAANLRHNLVFEARATVSVLSDEEVNGGGVMRRFKDLKLVRDANPVFTLTWMIMHPIDKDSPIAHWRPGEEPPAHSEIIVVLSGIDDGTGQGIHGRWAYAPSDIRWNARFVDILGRAPDGTRTIDYRCFNDTVPVEPA